MFPWNWNYRWLAVSCLPKMLILWNSRKHSETASHLSSPHVYVSILFNIQQAAIFISRKTVRENFL